MIKLLFTLAVIVTASFLHAQTLDPEWVRFQVTRGQAPLPFVITDTEENLFICGETYHPGPITGFITTKYDSSGTLIWEKRYDWFTVDEIESAVTDQGGNIYVGGNTGNPFNGLAGLLLIKYSAAGDSIWAFRYHQDITGISSRLAKVILLPDQNILISGSFYNTQTQSGGALLICFSPDGEVIWESQNPDAGSVDAAVCGDEIVIWGLSGTTSNLVFSCWKTTLSGQSISTFYTPLYDDDFGREYHIDLDGNFYVGDRSGAYKVTKYDTKGDLLWNYSRPVVPGPTPNFLVARGSGIATDEEENMWMSGVYYSDSINGRRHFTTLLDKAGNVLWEHIMVYNSTYQGSYVSDAVYQNGKYYTTGAYTTDIGNNLYEYYLSIYDKTGFVWGGLVNQTGSKNLGTSVCPTGNYCYISGIAEDSIFTLPTKQYLAKIKIPEAISLTASPSAIHKRIAVIPNPASGFTQISFEQEGGSGTGIFHFIDRSGRVCLTKITPVYTGENSVGITELAALPAGWYAIKVVLPGGRIYSGQVVKQ